MKGIGGGWRGAFAAAVALGVGELAAIAVRPSASPLVAVGGAVIDATPAGVKDFAIRTFGVYDKAVLIGAMVVVVGAVMLALGRRPLFAGVAIGCGAGFAALVAAGRPGADLLDVVPSVVSGLAGSAALWLAVASDGQRVRPPGESSAPEGPRLAAASLSAAGSYGGRRFNERVPESSWAERRASKGWASRGPGSEGRRILLVGSFGLLIAAAVGGVAGRVAGAGQAVAATFRLPRPASPAKPLPAGVDLRVPGLTPFTTLNRDFYRVDTALVVPRVDPRNWTLRITGMVDRPLEIDFADLLARPLVERDITLTCVSNEVGGPYAGHARWLGAPLLDLLREAGVRRGADQLLSTSADGFTCGTPLTAVMDGRDALLAVAMNGDVLPAEHGFPARMVIPGLYGYASATKWVVELKLTTFAAEQAYWVRRGWAPDGEIKTMSRIDVPAPLARVQPGPVQVAGVAWAQRRGVAAVEVRADDGPWSPARLAEVPGIDTWRQWTWTWQATPGTHRLEVRATDGAGRTQQVARVPPFPDGATGHHSIVVTVP
ncbi:molybdopterin-dependent oxidoreductase [Herbidospora sp. RD11066]